MNTIQNSTTSNHQSQGLSLKIFLAFAISLTGVVLVNVFAYETQHWNISGNLNHLLRGALFSTLVILGIWFIRQKTYTLQMPIGYGKPSTALKTLALGLGLILVPLIITLSVTHVLGWAQVRINSSATILGSFILGFIATFLTDALPEEVIFRGYIYAQLNTRFHKLKSSLISVVFFALFPMLIVLVQKLLNYPIYIGGDDRITPSFMITMVFFGSFMQYLRVLTKSLWTSVGFHTLFVFMNMLMGTSEEHFIQLTAFTSETPMQILLICLVVLTFALVIAYPFLKKEPIQWRSR